jgi:hypothetical protein
LTEDAEPAWQKRCATAAFNGTCNGNTSSRSHQRVMMHYLPDQGHDPGSPTKFSRSRTARSLCCRELAPACMKRFYIRSTCTNTTIDVQLIDTLTMISSFPHGFMATRMERKPRKTPIDNRIPAITIHAIYICLL